MSTAASPARPVVAALALLTIFVFSFLYAGANPRPHDLPVGIAGPAAATAPVAAAVERRATSEFEVARYPSEQAAREAIDGREIYGALVVGAGPPRLLKASGASAAVAGLLEGTVQAEAGSLGEVAVEDVKPLAAGDPRGAALGLMLLPLVIVSIVMPVLLTVRSPGLGARTTLAALVAFSLAGGLIAVGIAVWLDALPGSYLALSGVAALTMLAVSATTSAFFALLGLLGAGLGFLAFLIVGNVASGAATAPELLPGLWRAVGPYLPPGAGVAAIRGVAYFGGAGLWPPLAVLAAFALGGGLMMVVLRRRAGGPPAEASRHVEQVAVS